MSNPRLTKEQREQSFMPLLKATIAELDKVSGGDPDLLFALRRKLWKELNYLERDKPGNRRRTKILKFAAQKGLCAICGRPLPKSYTELDRYEAKKGYTVENTRLVHHECHIAAQKEKGYA